MTQTEHPTTNSDLAPYGVTSCRNCGRYCEIRSADGVLWLYSLEHGTLRSIGERHTCGESDRSFDYHTR